LGTKQNTSLETKKKLSKVIEGSLEPQKATEVTAEEEKKEESEAAIAEEEEETEPIVEEAPQEEISEVEEEAEKEKAVEKEKRKGKVEEEIVEERIYTIPLRRAWISPPKKRSPKAVRVVKSFIQRHMKLELGGKGEEEEKSRLVISNEVNEKLWARGIEKPPRKIRVRAVKDKEGIVTLYLAKGD
jgi:large subunit ribosomal protein L31e